MIIINIRDIARLSNVSVTTVSMILNNKAKEISEETKQRVLKVIEENNYTPNLIARSLATNKTNVIGLLVPDITNPYFPELVKSIEDKASNLGYNILLCNTENNIEKEKRYINLLKDKHVDGIIFISATSSDHNSILELSQCEIPIVVLDRVNEGENLKAVYVDNVEGGYLATSYFIKNGHRNIGCITGPLNNKSAKDRYAGYCKALKENGIEVSAEFIYEGDYNVSSGEKGIVPILKAGATAVFVGNDLMALGVYKTVYEKGLKIPKDISIIGYDDIYFSSLLYPPLTTVSQPRCEMGKEALRLLLEMINKETNNENSIEYIPKLIERSSVRIIL